MPRNNPRRPLRSDIARVSSTRALYSKTNELFYAQAGLAAYENDEQSPSLRRAQEAYLAQYYETAGHIIALADGLKYVEEYVRTQRARRHDAIYQTANERPLWRKRSRSHGLVAIDSGLLKLNIKSEERLAAELNRITPKDEWASRSLEGYQQFEAAVILKEHAAEDMVGEDRLFCSKVVPRLGIVALKEPYDLLQASL